MSAYTATFFDNLTDSVLQSLHVFATVNTPPHSLTDYQKEVMHQTVDTYQHQEFCQEVNAAMERRFGAVPGY